MKRVLAMAAAVAAVAGFVSGCGGSSGGGAPTSPTPPPQGPAVLTIDIVREAGAQSFSPNPASPGGRMVAFRNIDSVVHRVRLNNGTIDTGDILPGQTSSPVQMPAAGTNYHCPLHPTMIGAVNASDGDEAPPCQDYC